MLVVQCTSFSRLIVCSFPNMTSHLSCLFVCHADATSLTAFVCDDQGHCQFASTLYTLYVSESWSGIKALHQKHRSHLCYRCLVLRNVRNVLPGTPASQPASCLFPKSHSAMKPQLGHPGGGGAQSGGTLFQPVELFSGGGMLFSVFGPSLFSMLLWHY